MKINYLAIFLSWYNKRTFQSIQMCYGQSNANKRSESTTVFVVIIAAIHWTVAKRHNPWSQFTVFWFVRFTQIVLQPFVLICQWLESIVQEVVEFGVKTNKVHWSHVETIVKVLRLTRHIEACSIVWEVTEKMKRQSNVVPWVTLCFKYTYYFSSWLPAHTMYGT